METRTESSSPTSQEHQCCRRTFLKGTLGCGAYTLLALAAAESSQKKAFAQQTVGEPAVQTKFARVDQLAEGAWSVVSTPTAGDFTTLSNGGIIAGNDATLVIEGFQSAKGAAWLRDVAKELTGRYPTYVALTHFHADHSNGLSGYFNGASSPTIVSTHGTRGLLGTRNVAAAAPNANASGLSSVGTTLVLPDTVIADSRAAAEIDLGGRTVRLTPRVGHTPSDMTIEIDDPKITFCGDLFFNAIFPNYMDAVPATLTKTCKSLLGDSNTIYVPGHGAVATDQDIRNYLGLLDLVEESARTAVANGTPAKEAAKGFAIPDSLGTWFLFRPTFFETAFAAWESALKA